MTIWRWAALAGLGVLAIATGFGMIPGIEACGLPGEPILEFEFVRSTADVLSRFPEHCRNVHLEAQENGLWLDALAFIPTYSAFLILTLIGLEREGGFAERLAGPAILLVLAAACADQFEGTQLFGILGHLPGTQEIIDRLTPAVYLKFALLSVATFAIGAFHLNRASWRKLPGAFIALASIGSLYGLFFDRGTMGLANLLGWSAVLIANIAMSFRKTA